MLRKLIHDLFHKTKPGGLAFEPIGDGASPKFRRYRDENAEALFGYVPPKTLGRAKELQAKKGFPDKFLPFQNSILSCVHATVAFFKGLNTNFEYFFAWRWTYGQVPHYNGGTRFKDAMDVAQKGMLLNAYLPQDQYWGGEAKMQELWVYSPTSRTWHKATDQEKKTMATMAAEKTLGPWSYIYGKDITAIKHCIDTKKAVLIGVYVQQGNWHRNGVIYYNPSITTTFGHMIAIYDWDDDKKAWIVTDWDGGGFRYLDYNYPLAFAVDASDGANQDAYKIMNRVVKLADNPEYYVVWADNTKTHIPSWELFRYGFGKGYWVNADKVEVMKKEDFDRIPNDAQSEHLLKIIDEFNSSHS